MFFDDESFFRRVDDQSTESGLMATVTISGGSTVCRCKAQKETQTFNRQNRDNSHKHTKMYCPVFQYTTPAFIYLHYNSCAVLLVLYFMPNSVFSSDRNLRSEDITVNLWVVNERWLFSLLWCAGASSVTTNACHLLKDMEQPDWVMVSNTYSLRRLVARALFHLPAIKTIG